MSLSSLNERSSVGIKVGRAKETKGLGQSITDQGTLGRNDLGGKNKDPVRSTEEALNFVK